MGDTDRECRGPEGPASKMAWTDFHRLSEFIERELGIKMPDAKKTMLECRLQKRLRILGLKLFSQYCDYVFSSQGIESELVHMIDMVTTNKTDFFREPDHFEYLVQQVLPEMVKSHGAGITRSFTVWSAGCSTGEEPYTLAMVLNEFSEKYPGLGFNFTILGTDISSRVLDVARNAVYQEDRIAPVPMPLRKKYLLRGTGKNNGLVRIVPELRDVVKFRRLNFMEGDFGMRGLLDGIFCRNVFIYFDKSTQEKLLARFCSHVVPGGYIFIGMSETLSGMDLPLRRVNPSIYKKIA